MFIRTRTMSLGAAVLACPMLLGGCETMSDRSVTQLQGAGLGAGAGAALGALLGGGRGALLGSTIGAGLGLGGSTLVANRKQAYVQTEATYDAQIRQAEAENRRLASYNQGLSQQVAAYDRQIAALRAQVQSGAADHQAARRAYDRVQASYAESSRMLEEGRRELARQQQDVARIQQVSGAQSDRRDLANSQIVALADHVSVLQRQVEVMASQRSQLEQFR